MTFPAGACDTHMHVYDSRYSAASTATIFPPDAHVDEYRAVQAELGLERVVVVQPTTYGLDNRCQLEAAEHFGDAARLVVVVNAHTPPTELQRLHNRGARGARFHMLPGGAVEWDELVPTARHVAELGWHIQIQMDGNLLHERVELLRSLPTDVVVDHVGRFMPPPAPDSDAFGALLGLLDTGRCWVKLSAPYESTHDGAPRYPAVTALAEHLVAHAPERLVWASNWPHPKQDDPLTPSELAALAACWLPTDDLRRHVLVTNPARLYDFPDADHDPRTGHPITHQGASP